MEPGLQSHYFGHLGGIVKLYVPLNASICHEHSTPPLICIAKAKNEALSYVYALCRSFPYFHPCS